MHRPGLCPRVVARLATVAALLLDGWYLLPAFPPHLAFLAPPQHRCSPFLPFLPHFLPADKADWNIVKKGWEAHVLGEAPHYFKDATTAVKTLRVSVILIVLRDLGFLAPCLAPGLNPAPPRPAPPCLGPPCPTERRGRQARERPMAGPLCHCGGGQQPSGHHPGR